MNEKPKPLRVIDGVYGELERRKKDLAFSHYQLANTKGYFRKREIKRKIKDYECLVNWELKRISEYELRLKFDEENKK